jgi:Sulfatase-modifying factor enzyme 1/TIR domain/FHA domain
MFPSIFGDADKQLDMYSAVWLFPVKLSNINKFTVQVETATMPQIFVSYKRNDEEFARKIYKSLTEKVDAKVWLDVVSIRAGADWSDAIHEGLIQSDLLLLIITPEAMASQNVADEWKYFHSQKKPIVPLLLRPVDNLHFQLNRLQYIDFHKLDYEQGIIKLIQELRIIGLDEVSTLDDNLKRNIEDVAASNQFSNTPYLLIANYKSRDGVQISDKYPLTKTEVRVGRSDDNDFTIKEQHLSRHHFKVTRVEGGYVIEDNGSANGIVLERREERRRLSARGKTFLESGDSVEVPACSIEYQAPSAEELEQLLRQLKTLSDNPIDRAKTGRMLAAYCDPRPGVGLSSDGLPNIKWNSVPGGNFIFQQDEIASINKPFFISQYPVTVAQFEAFIRAGGYGEEKYWDNEGLIWRGAKQFPNYWNDDTYNISNHPVVGVSVFEACAFCKWLSSITDQKIRLPHEDEWEKAARSEDGRAYPWGNYYNIAYANVNETRNKFSDIFIERTTAVGIYEAGESPYGLFDMCGNVWEWCFTRNASTPVLRGGSWISSTDGATCLVRSLVAPDECEPYIGFRVLMEVET